jgi:hypothetical protein
MEIPNLSRPEMDYIAAQVWISPKRKRGEIPNLSRTPWRPPPSNEEARLAVENKRLREELHSSKSLLYLADRMVENSGARLEIEVRKRMEAERRLAEAERRLAEVERRLADA